MNTKLQPKASIPEQMQKLKQLNAKLEAMHAQEKISAEDYQRKKQEIAKRFKQLKQLKQREQTTQTTQTEQPSREKSVAKTASDSRPKIVKKKASVSPYETPKASLKKDKLSDRVYEEYELWNPNAAASWCVLFSPIFGAWLQAINWEELGEHERAKASKMWVYLTPIITIIGLIFDINIGLIVLLAWYFTEGNKQAKYLKENDIDYIKKPWGKVLGIATLGLFVFYGLLVVIFAAIA